MMKNRRPIVTAAAVLVISAVAGSTLAEGASTLTPAALARQLASRVAAAPTNAARYQAVLDVMKALHVPVFTADGKQLSPGSRGLPRDLNLYDFQLRTVADSFRVLTSIDDFASLLSAGGKRVDPVLVRRTLLRGVQAALQRRSSPASTVGLLVRELGLHHRPASDLARNLSPDKVTLDRLQSLLIILDAAARSGPARVMTSRGGGTSPCEGSEGFLTRLLGFAGLPIGPALPIWRVVLLNLQLESMTSVRALMGVHLTHYGPAGHAPFAGRELQYGIHAEITEEVPDEVKCGYFVSEKRAFPPKGPLRRSALSWIETGGLSFHGQAKRVDERTDSNGNALFTFDPKNEKFPGFGSVVKREGIVSAQVTVGQTNVAVRLDQPWTVEFHGPRGFKFSGSYSMTWTGPDGSTIPFDYAFAASVCGDDPYATWKLKMTQVGGGATVSNEFPLTVVEGASATTNLGSGIKVTVQLRPETRAVQVSFTAQTAAGGSWSPDVYVTTAGIVEDTSCPEQG